MKRCLAGGVELWWCEAEQREEVKALIAWLKDFENRSEEDDEGGCGEAESATDLAWEVDPYFTSNAYLISGAEGKSALAAHLARSLRRKLIEINNADQEVINLIPHVQEATQSRILRSTVKKTKARAATLQCATFPILLLDDVDANAQPAAPFLPCPLSPTSGTSGTSGTSVAFSLTGMGSAGIEEWGATSPIGALTTLDCWCCRQKPVTRPSYLKSVRQLILQSKAPILITTATPSVHAPAHRYA